MTANQIWGAWWAGERGGDFVLFYQGTEAGAKAAVVGRSRREPDSLHIARPLDNPPWETARQ